MANLFGWAGGFSFIGHFPSGKARLLEKQKACAFAES
jgi:hypothetical protein